MEFSVSVYITDEGKANSRYRHGRKRILCRDVLGSDTEDHGPAREYTVRIAGKTASAHCAGAGLCVRLQRYVECFAVAGVCSLAGIVPGCLFLLSVISTARFKFN